MATSEEVQRDQQWAAPDEETHRAAFDALMMDRHTALPGIIDSFDAGSQTANVRVAIKREFRDLGVVELPLLVMVPVHFPAGGGFVMTFPVANGDECLLVFAERAIDNWFEAGGVQEASDHRFHDLSDAFAIVGFRSKPRALPSVATDAVEIRTDDGMVAARFEGGSGLGLTMAPPIKADLGNPSDPMTTWLTAVGAATGAGPPPSTASAAKVKVT